MLKKLLGETAIYGVSSILGRMINYILVPIHTTVFATGEFGKFTELYAYIAFLNVIFTYGMETAFFRFASKHKDQLGHYFNLSQTSIIFTTLFGGLCLYGLGDRIAFALGYPEHALVVKWLVLILCIDTLVALPFARLRLEGQAKKFATFRISGILINVALNAFFLLWLPNLQDTALWDSLGWMYNPDWGIEYVFLANLMGNGVFLIFFLPTWLRFRFSFSRQMFSPVVKYALPIMILGLAGVTNEMLSRALLKYVLPQGFYPGKTNVEALGVFGAVYKLSIFMTLAVQAFKYAYEPFFFKKAEESDSREMNSKVMTGFIYFTCLCWLGLTIILPELAPLFLRQADYREGLYIVPVLLGGGVFLGVFYNLSVWYKLTDRNWYGAFISIGGALTTIILNLTLIPVLGYLGSAWASFFTFLAMSIASYWMGRKYYPVPYQLGRTTLYLLVAFIFVMSVNFLSLGILQRYLLGTGMLLTYIFLIFRLENLKEVINLRRLR